MVRLTISLPDDLYEALREVAARERRTMTAQVEVLLGREFARGGDGAGGGVVALPASASANGDGLVGGDVSSVASIAAASPPASSSRTVPARPAARTAVCEHRIPASGFCKVCDGG